MKLLFFFTFFFYSLSILAMAIPSNYFPSKTERLAVEIIKKTAISIEEKHKIKAIGEGGSMPGGTVRNLMLAFDSREKLSKNQLRKLLLNFSEEFLKNVNSCEEIQNSLVKRPFTIENVHITIYNHDSKGRTLYDPEIGVARISDGILGYSTNDPQNEFNYKNEYEETYEEALKAIKNEQL